MLPQARTDKLLVQDIGDELIVYDQLRHRAHRLNDTASTVWRHCDGETGIADLASILASKLGMPPNEDLIWLALSRLERAHLLRGSLDRSIMGPVSRREVMRKIGAVGTLTFLLPVVTSISAPTPAMAQSSCSAINSQPCCW
jgi:hypothetical protein